MNQTIQVLVCLSVLANALFVSLGVWIILKRGGLPYLAMRVPLLKKLGVSIVQAASFNFPYYDHRQSQLSLLLICSTDIVFLGDSITDEGEWAELCNNPAIKNRGISSDTTIGVFDASRYPRSKHLFIIDMMRKFELCFDLEGFHDQKFLLPDLLTKEEPYTGD